MNKDTHPNEIDKEADSLFKEMKQLFDEKINANLSDNQVLPFKFKTMEPEENFESFSKAADEIISRKLHETEFEEQQATERSGLAELNRIIKEQEETIEKLEKESEVNNKKGQLVFEKYQELSKIFEQVNKDRKEMPWEDLKKKYKNYKFIKEISKEGKILVDI